MISSTVFIWSLLCGLATPGDLVVVERCRWSCVVSAESINEVLAELAFDGAEKVTRVDLVAFGGGLAIAVIADLVSDGVNGILVNLAVNNVSHDKGCGEAIVGLVVKPKCLCFGGDWCDFHGDTP